MRIQSIDILRGIAILGILLMNIYHHSHIGLGYIPPLEVPLSDELINLFNTVFADGRFRTLFCILFGVGLAIQINSCKKKGLNIKDFFKSRLNWLLLFGLIHGVFIFGGDILLLYSLSALFIINKIQTDTKTIYKFALRYLWIGSILFLLLTLLFLSFFDEIKGILILRDSVEYLKEYNAWFGNYFYQVLEQAGTVFIIILISPLGILWQTAGLMLLGAYLYKIRFFKYGFRTKMFLQVLFFAISLTAIDIYI